MPIKADKPVHKKVVTLIAYLSSEKIIKISIGVFTHAWVARYLGPEDYGKLGYVISFMLVFTPLISLGADESLAQKLIENEKETSEITNNAFGIRLAGSLIGAASLFSVNYFLLFEKNIELFHLINLYSFFFITGPFFSFEEPFLSRINAKAVFWSRMSGYASGTTLRMLGIFFRLKLPFFLLTYLIEEGISKLIILSRYLKQFKFKPDLKLNKFKKGIIAVSWPILFIRIMFVIEQRLPFYFLQKLPNKALLGHYTVSFTLVDLWYFLPLAFCTSAFPVLVKNKSLNHALYDRRKDLLLFSCIWLSIGLVIGTNIFSKLIIGTLYGPEYHGAEYVLNAVSFMPIIYFFNLARSKLFILEGEIKLWGVINLVAVVLFFIILLIDQQNLTPQRVVSYYFIAHLFPNIVFQFNPFVRSTTIVFVKSFISPLTYFNDFKQWIQKNKLKSNL